MKDKTRLLIVEDNVALAENLFEFLGEEAYVLDFASDGLTALHLLATHAYDVIVLDVMVPGVSGFDICQRIRQDLRVHTPIIFMTAKDEIEDKVKGFTLGGDDYLVKPFDLRELVVRIQALKRRPGTAAQVLQAGPVIYDPGTLKVQLLGQGRIELSGTAARIFEAIIRAHPRFVPYETLHGLLWPDRDVDANTLRTHVYMLRKQFLETYGTPLVKTLHGRGYVLAPPGEE